jgi:TP901 family phage tail tape measure protein
MPEQLGTAVLDLTADESKLHTGIDNAEKSARQKIKGLGKTTMKAGAGITAGLTAPIVGFGAKAADVAGDFESQMNTLTIAASSSGTSLDTLRNAAITTGADTRLVGISAAESAEAMENFYKAGLSTADVFGGDGQLNSYLNEGAELSGALRAAINLAAASELDLASASDAVTVAMATYGIPAEEATRITDNFVQAADASVTSVPMMAEALKNVGPTMASYGISLEDTNNALAILSQRGIEGGEAGTALKSMFTNLQRPTKSVQEALADANVELYDTQGNLRDMPDIIDQFVAGTADMTEEQRNLTIQQAAGTYGMKALQSLMAEGTEGWYAMAEATEDAASAQNVAGARTQGFKAAMEALEGTVETFMIQAGTPLIQNVLTPLVNDLAGVIGKLAEADPKFFETGIKIAGVVAAAGPLLVILGAVITAIGALLSPIGLVVAGIVALAAAFIKANGGIKPTIKRLTGLGKAIQKKVAPIVEDFGEIWGVVWPEIQHLVEMVLDDIVPAIMSALTTIADFFEKKFDFVADFVADNMDLIKATIKSVMGAIEVIWKYAWKAIQTYLRIVWEEIKAIIDVALTLIAGLLKAVMQAIQGDWRAAWETIKETATTIVNRILEMLRNILNIILELFGTDLETLWETVKHWFTEMWNTITAWIADTWEAITTFFADLLTDVRTKMQEIWTAVFTWFTEMWNTIDTWVSDTWDRITTFFADLKEDINSKLEQIHSTIGGWVSELYDALIQPYVDTWNWLFVDDGGGVFGRMKSEVGAKIEAIKGVFDTKKQSILDAITAPFEDAKEFIVGEDGIITTLGGLINDIIGEIDIQLPHLETDWVDIPGLPFDRPVFDIEWYAGGTPMGGLIFDSPTVIGVGEAGPERVTIEPLSGGRRGGGDTYHEWHLQVPQPIGEIADLRNTLRLLEMATG